MYGYAGASAAATTVTPFATSAPTINPGGLAGQTAAVTQTADTSAGSAQTTLSQLTSAVPTALQGLASPAASTSSSTSGLSGILSQVSEASSALQTLEGVPLTAAIGAGDGLIPPAASLAFASGILANAAAPPALAGAATPLGSALGAGAGSGAGALGAAGLGKASLVGALSAPQAWTSTISHAAAALPGSGVGAAPAADAAGPGGLLGGLPRTGASVRAKRGAIFGDGIRRLRVIPRRGYTG
jgi:PPE-repeat protein